jgi:hypothetical protein
MAGRPVTGSRRAPWQGNRSKMRPLKIQTDHDAIHVRALQRADDVQISTGP